MRFLLELEWPTGRLIREYTLLLEPRGTGSGEQRVAVADADEAVVSHDDSPDPGSRPARMPATSPAGDTTVTGEGHYGPVRTGSSAWAMAVDVRSPGANIYQTMIAIYQANPDAFRDNDRGRIKHANR